MTTLRERKKRALRDQIINVAENAFNSQGYEKTTIAQIAKSANIGMGTFYNYFPSKSELYLYTFINNKHHTAIKKLNNIINYTLNNPNADLIKTLTQLIDVLFENMQDTKKEFWKELLVIFTANYNDFQKHMQKHTELDIKVIEHLAVFLNLFKEKGILAPDFNIDDGANCIFGIITSQVLMYYVYEKTPTFEQMRENTHRLIKLFFTVKLS
ncbi:MAG: TetR/AcrR family transcriptional regulator [Clostridia bacterium]|nr:TetR/AcrR family transcriptional regulator [Clostridia bacterium]MDD4048418.1 TetR/AcrR family transcriptional regulator [Clostridia bacterium]